MDIILPDEKYKIVRQLGKGGQGDVYLAENIRLNTLWAIKRMPKSGAAYGNNDMLTEINILKKLDHPALPKIIDLLEDDDYYYMVSDYIEGATLMDELSWVGRFELKTVIGWLLPLCEVMEYLHSLEPNPIVYRDFKPSNIILTKSGELKLVDFGIARELDECNLNETMNLGTVGYAPPEQYERGKKGVTGDIYSVGVLAYHLLTGVGPSFNVYDSKPASFYNPRLPDSIVMIIEKCIKPNPEERYQRAFDLSAALKSVLAPEPHVPAAVQTGGRNGRTICYKGMILSVPDNYEFACEFAYCAAGITGLAVLLINAGTYSGVINGYFETKPAQDIVIDKVSCESAACGYVSGMENLHITSIKHLIKDGNINRILEACRMKYDLIVVFSSKLLDTREAAEIIKGSSVCATAIGDNLLSLKNYAEYAIYMRDSYSIPGEKFKFALFDCRKDSGVASGRFEGLVDREQCLGRIAFSKQREASRNSLECFASRNFNAIKDDYYRIICSLNIAVERHI